MSETAGDVQAEASERGPREWLRLIESGDDPLEVLRVVGTYQRYLAAIEDRAVMTAKGLGRSWEDIAKALGVKRQSAWARYGVRASQMSTGAEIKEIHNLLPLLTDPTAIGLRCPNCGSWNVVAVRWKDGQASVLEEDAEGEEVVLPGDVRWTCATCKRQHLSHLESPAPPK